MSEVMLLWDDQTGYLWEVNRNVCILALILYFAPDAAGSPGGDGDDGGGAARGAGGGTSLRRLHGMAGPQTKEGMKTSAGKRSEGR